MAPLFASLDWYLDVGTTIDAIYVEELHRHAEYVGGTGWIWHAREEGRDADWIRTQIRESAEWHAIHDTPPPPPPFIPLPRLVPEGQHFRLDTGGRFTAIQCSDFNLLNRWQHGADITPILQQRQDAGFNMLRVWTLFDLAPGIGRFLDCDYQRLPEFLTFCAQYNLYVELTAYTSTFDPLHWVKLTDAVRGSTNVLVELVNEEDQPENHLVDLASYTQPTGVLTSHGSNGAEAVPVTPFWSYATFHTNGASEEQRKIGHNAMELWSGPTLTNETSRFPDVGMWQQDNDPVRSARLAYDSAAGAALLCAGACFHSVAGKSSVYWDAKTDAVARAFTAGARSVPLTCQDGDYRHRVDLETPEILREYQRGAETICLVPIQR